MKKFRCDYRSTPSSAWNKGDSHWDTYEQAVSYTNDCCSDFDQRVVYEGRVVHFRIGENTKRWVTTDPIASIIDQSISTEEKVKQIRELTLREAGGSA